MKLLKNLHPAWIAILIAIAVGLWLLSGVVQNNDQKSAETAVTDTAEDHSGPALVSVRTRHSSAQPMIPDAIISARTVPLRAVNLRSETQGKVIAVPPDKGALVKKGQIIARLAIRDRLAQRAQAQAILKQRELQYKAAQRMQAEGYQTEVDLAQARANLEIAQANVKSIAEDINSTTIRAPFTGVLEILNIDEGDYVNTGEEIARIVQRNPFLVQGSVSEDVVSHLKTGQPGEATLVDGRTLPGKLFFVATQADEQTRSFPVELEVNDPQNYVVLGATARLVLPLPEVMAHEIEPATMTLNEAGDFGIKAVDNDGKVRFHKANIVKNRGGKAWLTGLPAALQIITVGQGFVSEGDPVSISDDSMVDGYATEQAATADDTMVVNDADVMSTPQ